MLTDMDQYSRLARGFRFECSIWFQYIAVSATRCYTVCLNTRM